MPHGGERNIQQPPGRRPGLQGGWVSVGQGVDLADWELAKFRFVIDRGLGGIGGLGTRHLWRVPASPCSVFCLVRMNDHSLNDSVFRIDHAPICGMILVRVYHSRIAFFLRFVDADHDRSRQGA